IQRFISEKKMTLTGLLLFVLGLTTGENYRVHIYVSTPMTWSQAFTYCSHNYTDISTITSQEEHQLLVAAAGGTFSEAWIGLYRTDGNPNNWKWSDGQSYSFTNFEEYVSCLIIWMLSNFFVTHCLKIVFMLCFILPTCHMVEYSF
uniref:C-type lectin domain-containing protein n=2 Tax=Cyprinus carpio TaxID=7962 RepID=A0A9J7YVC0_CYPCA